MDIDGPFEIRITNEGPVELSIAEAVLRIVESCKSEGGSVDLPLLFELGAIAACLILAAVMCS